MSPQLKAALVRALIGATISFGLTFFTALQGADASVGKSAITAAVSAFTYLAARGAAEGFYDTGRQANGNVKAGDVRGTPG